MTMTSHLQDDLLLPDKWVIMQISPMLPSEHIWEQNVLAHVLQAAQLLSGLRRSSARA